VIPEQIILVSRGITVRLNFSGGRIILNTVIGAKLVEKFPAFYDDVRFTVIFLQPINGLYPESNDGRHILISRYLKPIYYYYYYYYFHVSFFLQILD
jgi:hypothetical protein